MHLICSLNWDMIFEYHISLHEARKEFITR